MARPYVQPGTRMGLAEPAQMMQNIRGRAEAEGSTYPCWSVSWAVKGGTLVYMKRTTRVSRFGVFSLLGCSALAASSPASSAAALPPPAGNKAIERNMKAISKNLSELGPNLTDAEKVDANLKLILDVQRRLLAVKRQKPSVVSDSPKEERAALQREFRLFINKALLQVIEMEIEILEGKGDAAAERMRGSLAEAMKAGHAKFRQR